MIMKHLGLPKEHITVSALGVSDEFHPFEENEIKRCRKKLKHYDGEKLLLHVGHNARNKNVEHVLKVLSLLNKKYPGEYKLIKIGDPFKHNQKRMIADLQLQDRIFHYSGVVAALSF